MSYNTKRLSVVKKVAAFCTDLYIEYENDETAGIRLDEYIASLLPRITQHAYSHYFDVKSEEMTDDELDELLETKLLTKLL